MPPAVITHCPARSIRRAFGVIPGNCRFDVGSLESAIRGEKQGLMNGVGWLDRLIADSLGLWGLDGPLTFHVFRLTSERMGGWE